MDYKKGSFIPISKVWKSLSFTSKEPLFGCKYPLSSKGANDLAATTLKSWCRGVDLSGGSPRWSDRAT